MRFRILFMLFVFLAGAAVPLAAKDSSKAREPKPKDDEEEVLTFTTEDLERKYGKSEKAKLKPVDEPQANAPKGQPGAEHSANEAAPQDADRDPLSWLKAREEAKREKAAQLAEAQRRVQAAQDKVAELQKRSASLRNPFLGRPQPTDEEKAAWKGNDQAGRLRITEENLAAARSELAQARTALNELR